MKLFDVYPLFDIQPVRGKGCYVYDEKGQPYLDLYGGHAVISIGHGHPHYVQQVKAQLETLPFYSNSVQNPLQESLALKLGQLSGCAEYQLFLCNSGAEANENALKLASFRNGRSKVIAFRQGFHGRTSAAVRVTDNPAIQAVINHGFDVLWHELNDTEGVQQSLAQGDICAVIVEGIQGIGGIYVPEPAFLQAIKKGCEEHGAVLILDEVQSGYGRSGQFFAFQLAGIEPHLITVAKGMGNGFPIGGVLIHPSFEAKHGLLGTTFGGSHLACAAGLAVLDVIESEQLMQNAITVGNYLKQELVKFDQVREVRGEGLMLGATFDFPVGALRKALLFEEHVFTGSASCPRTLRLLPPLSLSREEASRFLEKLSAVLSKMLKASTT
ncbi:MAG: aspartate aminotransferase family protein [Phaeodactylibacter sp.]|nr:aspartate aminotransferase family protein [Phaeodactylibacter sp.]MCB9273761.1 aspartate aminotransferase family protein [Lewinellaceae bacterium]